jgi:hypothetical protein
MSKRRSCAYYKCLLFNYLRLNESEMWSVTVESVRRFIRIGDDNVQTPVFVTLYDWNEHKKFQSLLLKCFRLRKININLLTLRNRSLHVDGPVRRCVNANKELWSKLFVVSPYDEYDNDSHTTTDNNVFFQQHNCVPSLFLALEQLEESATNIDHKLLQNLESYTFFEITNILGTYCTNENRMQLVNVCLQLQKPVINDTLTSWRRFVNLKTALYKLCILQRVPIRPDSDYKLISLLKCGQGSTNNI